MGTKESNLEKYKNLWIVFEKSLENENLNLSSFSKKWEKYADSNEVNDYNKIYDKLKKKQSGKDKLTRVHANSIYQLEEYIKFLDKEFFTQEILEDETPNFWFD